MTVHVILYGRTLEQTIDRHDRATFVKELVVTRGRSRSRWCASASPPTRAARRAPVLLVHGFGQNRYAWHLPARSLVNHLARAGYDVFNLDLRGHGRSRHFGARAVRHVDDYITEDLPRPSTRCACTRATARCSSSGTRSAVSSATARPRSSRARVGGVVSIGSPYHFTRGSLSLQAIALFFEGLRRAGVPHIGMPLPLYPVGAFMRTIRRVADSPFYPLPLRGWHAGALEPHVLEQHLRLAFDRAGIAELRNMFEWAADEALRRRAARLRREVRGDGPPAPRRLRRERRPRAARERPPRLRAQPLEGQDVPHGAARPHRSARRPRRAVRDVADVTSWLDKHAA